MTAKAAKRKMCVEKWYRENTVKVLIVKRLGSCWLWIGVIDPWGYGRIGKNERAHRASWRKSKGKIPRNKSILHRCDIASCIRPFHIYPGTQADNNRDMKERGRLITPFVRGNKMNLLRKDGNRVGQIRPPNGKGKK